jgi:hypothetical protein
MSAAIRHTEPEVHCTRFWVALQCFLIQLGDQFGAMMVLPYKPTN